MNAHDSQETTDATRSHRAITSSGLTHAEATTFVKHSTKEHVSNLVSFLLVLLAPAALFWALALLPWTGDDPARSMIVGLAIALALVIAGLVIHFVPGRRHGVLQAVEEGHVATTPASAAVARDHHSKVKPVNAVLVGFGVLAILAALACAGHALMARSVPQRVFVDIGCVFGFIAIAFAAFYWPFTTRRLVRHLGAQDHPKDQERGED